MNYYGKIKYFIKDDEIHFCYDGRHWLKISNRDKDISVGQAINNAIKQVKHVKCHICNETVLVVNEKVSANYKCNKCQKDFKELLERKRRK